MTGANDPTRPPAAETARAKRASAAERALAEAQARRQAAERPATQRPAEIGGPSGPDPVRYGDWERKGIASDF